MAFDLYLAQRIRDILERKYIGYTEKRMMGGLAFMVDEKMLCGIMSNKEDRGPRLMVRVGATVANDLLNHEHVTDWDLSARRMKDYVAIGEAGLDSDSDLEAWLDRCLAFNPLAKRSKRRGG